MAVKCGLLLLGKDINYKCLKTILMKIFGPNKDEVKWVIQDIT
jgi:hypothetical protein